MIWLQESPTRGGILDVPPDRSSDDGGILIEARLGIDPVSVALALRAVALFLEGEQFRQINFDSGVMLVEHRDRDDNISFVPAQEGCLREDGIVECIYPVPHK